MPAPKLQNANNPALASEWPANPLPLIVQTAPVAHQGAPALGGDQFAKRRNAILLGQMD